MSFSDAPISFPGLFGDWQFTVPVSYTHLRAHETL